MTCFKGQKGGQCGWSIGNVAGHMAGEEGREPVGLIGLDQASEFYSECNWELLEGVKQGSDTMFLKAYSGC